MEAILTLIVWAVFGFITMKVAEKKGRKPGLWLVLGIIFGFFAIIAVSLMPPV